MASTVKQMAPNALYIFMMPGSLDELRDRLSLRMTESTTEMELRLKTATEEMQQSSQFSCQVVNRDDDLDQAVADIDATIAAEKRRPDRVALHLL